MTRESTLDHLNVDESEKVSIRPSKLHGDTHQQSYAAFAMSKLIGNQPFHAMSYTGGRYDCGNRLGFLEANIAVALGRKDTARETRALLARLLKG